MVGLIVSFHFVLSAQECVPTEIETFHWCSFPRDFLGTSSIIDTISIKFHAFSRELAQCSSVTGDDGGRAGQSARLRGISRAVLKTGGGLDRVRCVDAEQRIGHGHSCTSNTHHQRPVAFPLDLRACHPLGPNTIIQRIGPLNSGLSGTSNRYKASAKTLQGFPQSPSTQLCHPITAHKLHTIRNHGLLHHRHHHHHHYRGACRSGDERQQWERVLRRV
jgi:hypothetical protein